jgi:hypothetical protein
LFTLAQPLLMLRALMRNNAPSIDLVALAKLHAALDFVVEIESLFAEVESSAHSLLSPVKPVAALAGEMRTRLCALLTRHNLELFRLTPLQAI